MTGADDLWTPLAMVRFDDAALESAVEDRLVRPLIRALRWPDECVHAKVPAAHRTGRKVQPGRKPEADYVLGEPTPGHVPPDRGYVVIETKRPAEDFADAREQAESYSFALRALLFVVCDGRHIQVWRTGWSDDTRLVTEARIDQLGAARAELERYLSPRAAREYHEQQKPTALRGDYDLADYVQHVRARTKSLSAIPRQTHCSGLGGSRVDVEVDSVSLPALVAPGTCTFLESGTGRGKTTVLQLLACAAVHPDAPSLLPLMLSAENVGLSLLEAALEELRPHVRGLESVAGVRRLFSMAPPLILLDDWHRATSAHRRLLGELPSITAAHGAVVVASALKGRRPSIATQQLSLDRYSPAERDAVVKRRTIRTTGGRLEASLPPELQPLAREPLFLDLLVDALRSDPKGVEKPPPNLTALMQRLLEVVTAREPSSPAIESITCVGARLANVKTFAFAEIQHALGECGEESSAAAFAGKMTMIGLWHRISEVGDHAFSNPAWRAYFQACSAFAQGGDWARWVRDAPIEELELAVPYAAHLAVVGSQENEFFRELLRRDAKLYMRSLGARTDGVRIGANDIEQATTVLHSLLAGYRDIIELFAPALQLYLEPWTHAATNEERSGQVCVDGNVSDGRIEYCFGLTTNKAEKLVSLEPVLNRVQRPRRAPSGGFTRRGVDLRLSQLRVDSGRLVATRAALDQIREVVAGKADGPLNGWLARERMAELVELLNYAGYLGEDISSWTPHELYEWMDRPERQHVSGWVTSGQIISLLELRRVMSSLEREGLGGLRLAEMAIARPRNAQDDAPALRQLFDAVVATYKTSCEAWFPEACKHLTYRLGPFRFVATLELNSVTYWLEPVEQWGTPCEVRTLAHADQRQSWDDLRRGIEHQAAELGREPLRSVSSSSRLLTDWRAPVTREVRSMLTDDLKSIDDWMLSAT